MNLKPLVLVSALALGACDEAVDLPGAACVQIRDACYPPCETDWDCEEGLACFIVTVRQNEAVNVCLDGIDGLEG